MRKVRILLAVSSVLLAVWAAMIIMIRPTYSDLIAADSLDMIDVLFPYFWVVVLAYSALCLYMFYSGVQSKAFFAFILVQFSLVLYYTPYALSGFSVNPDALWLIEVSRYLPNIISGKPVMFSTYAQTYPVAFALMHSILQVTGMDTFLFNRIFPAFSIMTMTFLAYVVASRFVSARKAFLAMLFVLPGWHFMDYHACPHVTGVLLFLTIMVLITRLDRRASALVFALILPLVFAHPVSPVTLGIFCAAAIFCGLVARRSARGENTLRTAVPLLFITVVWFSWMTDHVLPIDVSIQYAFRRVLTFGFSETILGRAREFSVGGGSFIYPNITLLIQGVYISYVIVASILLLREIINLKVRHKPVESGFKKLVLISASVSFIAFSFFLLLGTGDHHLLYRGLIPFVLFISIYIGWTFADLKKHLTVRVGSIAFIIFLFVTFPIVSYSIASYNVFPQSEGLGIRFVASYNYASGERLSMGTIRQIAPFINLTDSFSLLSFPPDLNETTDRLPQLVGLLQSSYYVLAMRYDLSFSNNRFLNVSNQLRQDVRYNRVYSNPTFVGYVLNP